MLEFGWRGWRESSNAKFCELSEFIVPPVSRVPHVPRAQLFSRVDGGESGFNAEKAEAQEAQRGEGGDFNRVDRVEHVEEGGSIRSYRSPLSSVINLMSAKIGEVSYVFDLVEEIPCKEGVKSGHFAPPYFSNIWSHTTNNSTLFYGQRIKNPFSPLTRMRTDF